MASSDLSSPATVILDDRHANPARWLYYQSWGAVAFIAALVILHQLLLQPSLARLTSDAPVINVAGRQRMLSQKLTKAALALEAAPEPNAAERRERHTELEVTLKDWTRAHHGLQHGDADLHLPAGITVDVMRAFAEVEPHFNAIVAAAKSIIAISPERIDPNALATRRAAVQTILQHESKFVTQMHDIVGLLEGEARARVRQLQYLGWGIMASILLLLLAVQWTVMRPAVQFVGREFEYSEEQYRRLVESMNDGVLVFDPQGWVRFANRRFGEIVGYPVAELLGKPVSIFVADADRRRFDQLSRIHGTEAALMEIALRHRDGYTVETLVSPRPLFERDGSPQGSLLVLTDMTARKQAEARSRMLLDQLAHADRLKSMGEMAAGLAHEINQPLGAIANYAEGCLAQLSDESVGWAESASPTSSVEPKMVGLADSAHPTNSAHATNLRQPLERILSAAIRGGEIIRRARSFAQLRPHAVAKVALNDLVREVEDLCLPEARRRGVFMTLQLAPGLPPVPVDAIQVQQVLTNLIQNAFHALEDTGAYRRSLTILTRLCPSEGIEVSVVDNGSGFLAADTARLFEPFVTTRAEGTGMGLAIARGIVESHGGRIWAERRGDGGAIFRFTLPFEASTLGVAGVSGRDTNCGEAQGLQPLGFWCVDDPIASDGTRSVPATIELAEVVHG